MSYEQMADREYATNVGMDHPERAWILSNRDVWYANPSYRGQAVPHPEDYHYDEDNDDAIYDEHDVY